MGGSLEFRAVSGLTIRRPIRILHAIGRLSGGGAETQLRLLVSTRAGPFEHAVGYLVEPDEWPTGLENVLTIRVERRRRTAILEVYRNLSAIVDKYRPDIMQLWVPEVITIPAAICAYIRGIPVISCQRRSVQWRGYWGLWFRDQMTYVQHAICDRLVTNFPVSGEPAAFRWLYSWKCGLVIRNAVRPMVTISRNTGPEFRIGFVGRLVPQKNLRSVIYAFSRLARRREGCFSLDVVGEGFQGDEMRALAKSMNLGESISFFGYRSNWNEIAETWDVLVLPSSSEGMPNVLLEAMAIGLPTIAGDIPEVRGLIGDSGEVSMLVPPDSISAIEEALWLLSEDRSLRDHLSVSGRKFASNFGREAMVRRYNQLFCELLNQELVV